MENNKKNKDEMLKEIKAARDEAVEILAYELTTKANDSLQANYQKALEELNEDRIVGYATVSLTRIKQLQSYELSTLCSQLANAFEPRGFKIDLRVNYGNDMVGYHLTVM